MWIESGGKHGQRGVLEEEDLSRVDLSGWNLSGMVLRRSNFAGAKLTNCVLMMANLEEVDLHGADLQRAVMLGTALAGADLKKADLSHATVGPIEVMSKDDKPTGRTLRTNLDNARLAGANLTQHQILGLQHRRHQVGVTPRAALPR